MHLPAPNVLQLEAKPDPPRGIFVRHFAPDGNGRGISYLCDASLGLRQLF